MAIKDLGLRIATVGLLLGSLLLVSEPVSAQWIFAAKHIEGRINQLTQDDQNGKERSNDRSVLLLAVYVEINLVAEEVEHS